MNPLKEEHEIKFLADFETLISQGKASYTGLVESVGYVYWLYEPVYLVCTNAKELFAKPDYQQVPGPYFIAGDNPVITQTVQRLYVMSEKDLIKFNYSIYYQFYVLPKERQKQTCETDAISSDKEQVSQKGKQETAIKSAKRKVSEAKDAWGTIDIASGILEDAGVIKLPKWLPRGKSGITALFIVADLYLTGDYVNAVGEVVQALNPYGVFIDIGKAMYNSDFMQGKNLEYAVPRYWEAVAQPKIWTVRYHAAKGAEKYKIEAMMDKYSKIADEYYKI